MQIVADRVFAIGELVVFATYNCDVDDKGKEDEIVERILESMALR